MEEQQPHLLEQEIRLLLSSIQSSSRENTGGNVSKAAQLLDAIEQGQAVTVLTHDAIASLLKPEGPQQPNTPAAFMEWMSAHVKKVVPVATPEDRLMWLIFGVAAYAVFLQENLTGPPVMSSLSSPCQLYAGIADELMGTQEDGQDSFTAGDEAATALLQVNGEDLQGKVSGLQWLLVASTLLVEPLVQPYWQDASVSLGASSALDPSRTDAVLGALPSWSWWALRVVSLHQHLLSGRSASLLKLSSELSQTTLSWLDTLPGAHPQADISRSSLKKLKVAACLEAAHVQHQYSHVEAARQLLASAGDALNLSVTVTGALGKRTVHQVDAKAQLVVVAGGTHEEQEDVEEDPNDGCVEVSSLGLDDVKPSLDLEGMGGDCEVFLAPQLDQRGQRAVTSPTALEQALLLALAQQVKKGSAIDELQPWQMAPYVEAVLSQTRSCYLLQLVARLLKARHEMTRTRTKERALLMMEKVVEAWQVPSPTVAVRLPLAASTWIPLRPLLRKELAEAYISMGFVGAALKIFENLEMWEHLIVCYRLLDKKMQADTLIRQRLKVQPNDPKLWCALGDLHLEEEYYETAWERSGQRHARSQRALGRAAVRKKDYAKATKHYELALALSPLYPDAWFAMGYSYLKIDEFKKALTAFTRVTQMDPEHGEAWNNVAALLLQTVKYREAFTALSETVKYKREDWRVWENYAHAAVKCGQLMSCVQGLHQVMSLSNGQHLPMEVLEQLVDKTVELSSDAADLEEPLVPEETLEDERHEAEANTAADAVASALSRTLGFVNLTAAAAEEEGGSEAGAKAGNSHSGTTGSTSPGIAMDSNESAKSERADEKLEKIRAERKKLQQRVLQALKSLLHQAANSKLATPELWGVMAKYYEVQGEAMSAKESLLKQVRGLQSSPFKSNPEAFSTMANALKGLAGYHIQLYEGGAGSVKDLASSRMQLNSFLKQTAEVFDEDPAHSQLQSVLLQIQALEAAAAAQ